MTLARLAFAVALAGYLAGAVCYLLHALRKGQRAGAAATAATLTGFAAHSLAALLRVYALGRMPAPSPADSLSLFAWAVVLIYLIVEFHYRNRAVGACALPLALAAALGSALMPENLGSLPPPLPGHGLSIHVVLAIFGNAAFAVTSCAGLMYLLQERRLKSRHPGRIRLPSLELLDDIGVRSVLVGFPLLTLALISGSVWAEHARGSFLTLRPREVWSLVSWLIFAGLFAARLSAGWRCRKAAILAILGFCLVLFTFVGVKILRDGSLL